MKLKERYAVIDYTNQYLIFIGDSLKEVKEWMIIYAEENENDTEGIENLPIQINEIRNYLNINYSLEIEHQNNEEYSA